MQLTSNVSIEFQPAGKVGGETGGVEIKDCEEEIKDEPEFFCIYCAQEFNDEEQQIEHIRYKHMHSDTEEMTVDVELPAETADMVERLTADDVEKMDIWFG